MDAKTIQALLPARPDDAHKGTFGKAFIVAGSVNFIGAAALAAGSAYRVGAGLVTLGIPQPLLAPLAVMIPEATWTLLPHDLGVVNKAAAEEVWKEVQGYDALLVGCGLGDEDETRDFMENLLKPPTASTPKSTHKKGIGLLRMAEEATADPEKEAEAELKLPPMVIDADGLNNLAKLENWWELLPPHTILTPHPRELGRLAGIEDTAEIQAQREQIALEKAKAWNVIIVLKGANTVIAAPDGRSVVSPFASAKLATAGTGDVLAGVIVGLLAQGLTPFDAAQVGVWLHAWAGIHGTPAYGVMASDVMRALGQALGAAHQGS